MADSRMVSHDGEVVEIHDQQVRVKIVSQSACADCHAKSLCSAADQKDKYIDAVAVEPLQIGDPVQVTMTEKMGWKAVLYGFFLPFIIMVAVLITVHALGQSEPVAGLAGLGSLLPYYLVLYKFRKHIEKDFVFSAEKKNKI